MRKRIKSMRLPLRRNEAVSIIIFWQFSCFSYYCYAANSTTNKAGVLCPSDEDDPVFTSQTNSEASKQICYEIVNFEAPISYDEAENYCLNRLGPYKGPGTLAIIKSQAEQDAITDALERRGLPRALIGLRLSKTLWRWVSDGVPLRGQGIVPIHNASDGCNFVQPISTLPVRINSKQCINACQSRNRSFAFFEQVERRCYCSDYLTDSRRVGNGYISHCDFTITTRAQSYVTTIGAYDNWAPNRPLFDTTSGCLSINRFSHLWFDRICTSFQPFLCQFFKSDETRIRYRLRKVLYRRKMATNFACSNRFCYAVISLPMLNFNDAFRFCENYGGILAKIGSQNQQAFIGRLLNGAAFDGATFVWIGATSSTVFRWPDGTTISTGDYENWVQPSQLLERQRVSSTCVNIEIDQHNIYRWRTRSCARENGETSFVCSCIPEPEPCRINGAGTTLFQGSKLPDRTTLEPWSSDEETTLSGVHSSSGMIESTKMAPAATTEAPYLTDGQDFSTKASLPLRTTARFLPSKIIRVDATITPLTKPSTSRKGIASSSTSIPRQSNTPPTPTFSTFWPRKVGSTFITEPDQTGTSDGKVSSRKTTRASSTGDAGTGPKLTTSPSRKDFGSEMSTSDFTGTRAELFTRLSEGLTTPAPTFPTFWPSKVGSTFITEPELTGTSDGNVSSRKTTRTSSTGDAGTGQETTNDLRLELTSFSGQTPSKRLSTTSSEKADAEPSKLPTNMFSAPASSTTLPYGTGSYGTKRSIGTTFPKFMFSTSKTDPDLTTVEEWPGKPSHGTEATESGWSTFMPTRHPETLAPSQTPITDYSREPVDQISVKTAETPDTLRSSKFFKKPTTFSFGSTEAERSTTPKVSGGKSSPDVTKTVGISSADFTKSGTGYVSEIPQTKEIDGSLGTRKVTTSETESTEPWSKFLSTRGLPDTRSTGTPEFVISNGTLFRRSTTSAFTSTGYTKESRDTLKVSPSEGSTKRPTSTVTVGARDQSTTDSLTTDFSRVPADGRSSDSTAKTSKVENTTLDSTGYTKGGTVKASKTASPGGDSQSPTRRPIWTRFFVNSTTKPFTSEIEPSEVTEQWPKHFSTQDASLASTVEIRDQPVTHLPSSEATVPKTLEISPTKFGNTTLSKRSSTSAFGLIDTTKGDIYSYRSDASSEGSRSPTIPPKWMQFTENATTIYTRDQSTTDFTKSGISYGSLPDITEITPRLVTLQNETKGTKAVSTLAAEPSELTEPWSELISTKNGSFYSPTQDRTVTTDFPKVSRDQSSEATAEKTPENSISNTTLSTTIVDSSIGDIYPQGSDGTVRTSKALPSEGSRKPTGRPIWTTFVNGSSLTTYRIAKTSDASTITSKIGSLGTHSTMGYSSSSPTPSDKPAGSTTPKDGRKVNVSGETTTHLTDHGPTKNVSFHSTSEPVTGSLKMSTLSTSKRPEFTETISLRENVTRSEASTVSGAKFTYSAFKTTTSPQIPFTDEGWPSTSISSDTKSPRTSAPVGTLFSGTVLVTNDGHKTVPLFSISQSSAYVTDESSRWSSKFLSSSTKTSRFATVHEVSSSKSTEATSGGLLSKLTTSSTVPNVVTGVSNVPDISVTETIPGVTSTRSPEQPTGGGVTQLLGSSHVPRFSSQFTHPGDIYTGTNPESVTKETWPESSTNKTEGFTEIVTSSPTDRSSTLSTQTSVLLTKVMATVSTTKGQVGTQHTTEELLTGSTRSEQGPDFVSTNYFGMSSTRSSDEVTVPCTDEKYRETTEEPLYPGHTKEIFHSYETTKGGKGTPLTSGTEKTQFVSQRSMSSIGPISSESPSIGKNMTTKVNYDFINSPSSIKGNFTADTRQFSLTTTRSLEGGGKSTISEKGSTQFSTLGYLSTVEDREQSSKPTETGLPSTPENVSPVRGLEALSTPQSTSTLLSDKTSTQSVPFFPLKTDYSTIMETTPAIRDGEANLKGSTMVTEYQSFDVSGTTMSSLNTSMPSFSTETRSHLTPGTNHQSGTMASDSSTPRPLTSGTRATTTVTLDSGTKLETSSGDFSGLVTPSGISLSSGSTRTGDLTDVPTQSHFESSAPLRTLVTRGEKSDELTTMRSSSITTVTDSVTFSRNTISTSGKDRTRSPDHLTVRTETISRMHSSTIEYLNFSTIFDHTSRFTDSQSSTTRFSDFETSYGTKIFTRFTETVKYQSHTGKTPDLSSGTFGPLASATVTEKAEEGLFSSKTLFSTIMASTTFSRYSTRSGDLTTPTDLEKDVASSSTVPPWPFTFQPWMTQTTLIAILVSQTASVSAENSGTTAHITGPGGSPSSSVNTGGITISCINNGKDACCCQQGNDWWILFLFISIFEFIIIAFLAGILYRRWNHLMNDIEADGGEMIAGCCIIALRRRFHRKTSPIIPDDSQINRQVTPRVRENAVLIQEIEHRPRNEPVVLQIQPMPAGVPGNNFVREFQQSSTAVPTRNAMVQTERIGFNYFEEFISPQSSSDLIDFEEDGDEEEPELRTIREESEGDLIGTSRKSPDSTLVGKKRETVKKEFDDDYTDSFEEDEAEEERRSIGKSQTRQKQDGSPERAVNERKGLVPADKKPKKTKKAPAMSRRSSVFSANQGEASGEGKKLMKKSNTSIEAVRKKMQKTPFIPAKPQRNLSSISLTSGIRSDNNRKSSSIESIRKRMQKAPFLPKKLDRRSVSASSMMTSTSAQSSSASIEALRRRMRRPPFRPKKLVRTLSNLSQASKTSGFVRSGSSHRSASMLSLESFRRLVKQGPFKPKKLQRSASTYSLQSQMSGLEMSRGKIGRSATLAAEEIRKKMQRVPFRPKILKKSESTLSLLSQTSSFDGASMSGLRRWSSSVSIEAIREKLQRPGFRPKKMARSESSNFDNFDGASMTGLRKWSSNASIEAVRQKLQKEPFHPKKTQRSASSMTLLSQASQLSFDQESSRMTTLAAIRRKLRRPPFRPKKAPRTTSTLSLSSLRSAVSSISIQSIRSKMRRSPFRPIKKPPSRFVVTPQHKKAKPAFFSHSHSKMWVMGQYRHVDARYCRSLFPKVWECTSPGGSPSHSHAAANYHGHVHSCAPYEVKKPPRTPREEWTECKETECPLSSSRSSKRVDDSNIT